MRKVDQVKTAFFALIFALCLSGWIIQQPLFAAEERQTAPTAANTYVVQPGDTLTAIANRFGTTVSVLLELNNLPNPNVILVGQVLIISATEDDTTVTPGSTVPEATPTQTSSPTVAATATPAATATATATLSATSTATPVATTPIVWTDPAAPIEVFSPVAGALYHSPIEVMGFSQTFEGNVNLRLSDDDGNILGERTTIGGSVDGFDFFHSYLRFTVTEPITGVLEIFETSAENGSEINKVTIPLILLPGQRVIDINNLMAGQPVCEPLIVAGYSNTFEATLLADLSERSGDVISQTSAMGGNLGVYAEFLATLDTDTLETAEAQPLLISAYEESASGAGPVDRTRFPVTFYPARSAQCP